MRRSVTADRLIDELDRLAMVRGYPAVLLCDNGPELACETTADWAGERVGLSFIPLGALAQRLSRVVQRPGSRRVPNTTRPSATKPQPTMPQPRSTARGWSVQS